MSNGGIIGKANVPTAGTASGVWTIDEVFLAKAQNIWPIPPINVTYLVIAGGGGGSFGGGGAGGYRTNKTGESSGGGSSAEGSFAIALSTNYTVTIGAGGTAGTSGAAGGSGYVWIEYQVTA
ncbi:hypothetical protein EBT31_13435 [bacterium]|nr:hypothetical protein [bacterium]